MPFNLGLLRHERVEVADVVRVLRVLQENVHLGQVGALLGNRLPRSPVGLVNFLFAGAVTE